MKVSGITQIKILILIKFKNEIYIKTKTLKTQIVLHIETIIIVNQHKLDPIKEIVIIRAEVLEFKILAILVKKVYKYIKIVLYKIINFPKMNKNKNRIKAIV